MKTPPCYNRDPFTDPNAGWQKLRHKVFSGWGTNEHGQKVAVGVKSVYRYCWPWFTDRCAAWDGPQVSETVPARECWACDGCKWLPAHARAWIRGEDDCD